ncbi:MAG TPA: nickel pincer cofactor biosynthesis protein LarC [Anaerovoracaceae bacterium]|nr:nickel pincer cofactor biosynthesis protein LarC [Anaerovoracaceae bacterium]
MERILYFDCFAGISGDMSLGALIDLGLEPSAVIEEIRKLGVKGYDIDIKKTERFSISGTDVTVALNGDSECDHEHGEDGDPVPEDDQGHVPVHDHGEHGHDHTHGHSHSGHGHSHDHGHSHHHNGEDRGIADLVHIIRNSGISDKAKQLSIGIFGEIAKAEAAVHGKRLSEVHFHEVGAVDSIVDIVGTAICIDMLKVDRIVCSPVHEGQGFVNCRHGRLPVPVPAVIKMLGGSGISIVTEDIQAELVTPTGFGILKTVSESCGKMPEMLVESVGYGFGKTDTGRLNALRVILGTMDNAGKGSAEAEEQNQNAPLQEAETVRDRITLLETNIDNTTGEALGYTMDRLMKAGALDVYFTPIQMKKNRPAFMLSVICKTNDTEKLSEIIFMETSTIGVRVQELDRITLKREIRTVKTELGEVRVKSVNVRGLERVQPEYEDCARIAEEKNLSLNEVYEMVKMKFIK